MYKEKNKSLSWLFNATLLLQTFLLFSPYKRKITLLCSPSMNNLKQESPEALKSESSNRNTTKIHSYVSQDQALLEKHPKYLACKWNYWKLQPSFDSFLPACRFRNGAFKKLNQNIFKKIQQQPRQHIFLNWFYNISVGIIRIWSSIYLANTAEQVSHITSFTLYSVQCWSVLSWRTWVTVINILMFQCTLNLHWCTKIFKGKCRLNYVHSFNQFLINRPLRRCFEIFFFFSSITPFNYLNKLKKNLNNICHKPSTSPPRVWWKAEI